MTTEDDLDAKVAKLFDDLTKNPTDGSAKKRLISDEETLDQMEREEAARHASTYSLPNQNREPRSTEMSSAQTAQVQGDSQKKS